MHPPPVEVLPLVEAERRLPVAVVQVQQQLPARGEAALPLHRQLRDEVAEPHRRLVDGAAELPLDAVPRLRVRPEVLRRRVEAVRRQRKEPDGALRHRDKLLPLLW